MTARRLQRSKRLTIALATTTAMLSSAAIASAHHIGNLVWKDTNNNGVVDAGERGIPGVKLELRQVGNPSFVRTTTTDANGNYMFWGLYPGDFLVSIPLSGQPFGACKSSTGAFGQASGPYEPAPDPNDRTKDNDDNGQLNQTATAIVTSQAVRLRTDMQVNETVDFGIFCAAGLGDYVWEDTDRDGIQDAGEPALPGVVVTLLGSSGNPLATTSTDANGRYRFDNLTPGTYSVRFDAPAGMSPTVSNGDVNLADNSDAQAATGRTAPVVLAEDEFNPNLDAGFVRPLPPPPVTPPPAVTPPTPAPQPLVIVTGAPKGSPKLVIRKTGPKVIRAGRVTSYVIKVRNAGDGPATGVVVRDVLPSGMTVVLQENGKRSAARMLEGGLTWNLGTIAAGATRDVRVSVRISSSASGFLENVATVRAANTPGTSRATARTRVRAIPPRRVAVTG